MIISIEKSKQNFTYHLEKENNSRILFSGQFGTGKSYFLKNYFADKDQYNIFWISPINYVVGTNQDIFEWIKVDIAKQLITEYLTSEKDAPISKNFLIQSYLYKNAGSIFEKLISVLTNEYLKAKTGVSILDSFKEDIEEYKKFETSAKEEFRSDFDKLQSFLNNSFQIKGSIYEDDLITRIIRVSLEVLKLNSRKKNILIIDDLDRLDPEHIFRILNILSAHNDHFDSNKFGFDKVIIACDYEGVESLYKHKYGSNTDFEGYIEKFFTYEPYYFSINDSIVHYCQNELRDFGLKEPTRNVLSLILAFFYIEKKLRVRNLSKIVSFDKIELNKINFIKRYNVGYNDPDSQYHNLSIREYFSETNTYEIDYSSFDIIRGIYLLTLIFGGVDKLNDALKPDEKRKYNFFEDKYLQDVFETLCIPSHIGEKISGNQRDIFLDFYDLGSSSNPMGVVNMLHPRIDFFGATFRLPLKWNKQNRYRSGSYFDQANPLAGLNKYSNEAELKSAPSFQNLIKAVSNVINLMKVESLLPNMK